MKVDLKLNVIAPAANQESVVEPKGDLTGVKAIPEVQQAESATGNGDQRNLRKEELEPVVDKMNQAMKLFNHALQFRVADSGRVIIKVIDTDSKEVIREIPPEALIEAFESFDNMIGVLFDRKV